MTRDQLRNELGMITAIGSVITLLVAGISFTARASTLVQSAQSSAERVDVLAARVDSLESGNAAVSYMTCVTFSETHPAPQVPTYCDKYTRPK